MKEKKLCRDCEEAEATIMGLCHACYRDWNENHCESDEPFEPNEEEEDAEEMP
jgi:NMD protein affecting ribosome stability and mRNA decay